MSQHFGSQRYTEWLNAAIKLKLLKNYLTFGSFSLIVAFNHEAQIIESRVLRVLICHGSIPNIRLISHIELPSLDPCGRLERWA